MDQRASERCHSHGAGEKVDVWKRRHVVSISDSSSESEDEMRNDRKRLILLSSDSESEKRDWERQVHMDDSDGEEEVEVDDWTENDNGISAGEDGMEENGFDNDVEMDNNEANNVENTEVSKEEQRRARVERFEPFIKRYTKPEDPPRKYQEEASFEMDVLSCEGRIKSNEISTNERRTSKSKPSNAMGNEGKVYGSLAEARLGMFWTLHETKQLSRHRRDKLKEGKEIFRPDLFATNTMRERGQWMRRNVIGPIEGIEVGKCFTYRAEMFVIGLHGVMRPGIACRVLYGQRIGISIVLNDDDNRYPDNRFQGEKVIYSGQGGNGREFHQKLEGDNLALSKSYKCKIPIRVVRRVRDKSRGTGHKYVYCGLYKICKNAEESRGFEGNIVYKFTLLREPNQLPLPRFKIE